MELSDRKAKLLSCIRAASASDEVASLLVDGQKAVDCETELWDYKLIIESTKLGCAELVRDVLAFYNTFGGYLLVGVSDDAEIHGAEPFHEQTLKQQVRNFSGVDVAVRSVAVDLGGVQLGLIYVPRRSTEDVPVAISKVGPESKSGKPIFKPGEVYFRANDSSQLIRGSDDLRFLMGPRVHSLEVRASSAISLIANNLPDRSVVFSRFFGRETEKRELWTWLADPLSRYRVVAGPGGFGKTSATYSFCEEVCREAPLGIEQLVWLSAKKEQFNPGLNAKVPLPYKAGARLNGETYTDFESLLDAISYHFAVTDEEWEGADEVLKTRILVDALSVLPSLIVVDDLDSLTPDDQRRALAFAMSLGRSKSRFIFTTRKNFLAPASATTQLDGLFDRDFDEFVAHLEGAYGRKLSSSERASLAKDTEKSPLFAESIFRLLRLGQKFSEALARWKGKDGEAVRAASFQRELAQLSFAAARVLYAISLFDTASSAEIRQVTELELPEVEGALQELDRLFLISSKQIGGQPRFAAPPNLKRLIADTREQSVKGWSEIARRAQALRAEAGVGKARGRKWDIAEAIQQAMAQLGRGEPAAAVGTIEEVLDGNSESADLWMVYARCLSRLEPIDIEKTRRAFTRSYELGKREPQLFEKWLEFEIEYGNSNAAVAVSEAGNEVFDGRDWSWFFAKARAYLRRAMEREKRREFSDSLTDFKAASKWTRRAVRYAPSSARSSVIALGQTANDSVWGLLCQGGAFSLSDQFSGAKSAVDFGDRRDVCVFRMMDVVGRALSDAVFLNRKRDVVESWLSEIERVLERREAGRLMARFEALRDRFENASGSVPLAYGPASP